MFGKGFKNTETTNKNSTYFLLSVLLSLFWEFPFSNCFNWIFCCWYYSLKKTYKKPWNLTLDIGGIEYCRICFVPETSLSFSFYIWRQIWQKNVILEDQPTNQPTNHFSHIKLFIWVIRACSFIVRFCHFDFKTTLFHNLLVINSHWVI